LIQQILSGLETGSWYGLLAMALVVIMKSTGVANFAIGDIGLLAAFLGVTLVEHEVPFALTLILAIAFAMAAGAFLEFFVMRRVPSRAHFSLLLMTIGLALTIDAAIELIWGTNPLVFPAPWTNGNLTIAGQIVAWSQCITIGIGFGAAFGLTWFFRTPTGVRMRAVAENPVVAQVLGISLNRVALWAWVIGAGLSGIVMVLLTQASLVTSTSAQSVIVQAFVAAILGGFSSLTGAFIAGLGLGVLENLAGGLISTGSQEAVALVLVLIVLLLKPRGFAGAVGTREV
jgi:branched-chain amino acid transport system permease protein